MRIGLIVPPFISVPPKAYGGTELFAAQLAEGLTKSGVDVVVYTNGESTVGVEKRWIYPKSLWPIEGDIHTDLRDINHGAWAVQDAMKSCDIIHISNAPTLVHSRFVNVPFVYTIHHTYDEGLNSLYSFYPDVWYVTISNLQQKQHTVPKLTTIHHGIDPSLYTMGTGKRDHFVFLGRIVPVKGAHTAVEVAKRTGIPLKIAGEIQPRFKDYYESQIKPHLDGKLIEYVGQADLKIKNELLSSALGLLFPIEWDEPFGLVMIEAMACGAPVYALRGGSVAEVVKDGVSGYVCDSVDDMVRCAEDAESFDFRLARRYVEANFSVRRMVEAYADLYAEILGEARGGSLRKVVGIDEFKEPRAIA
jgi:glycosyltransferase involved in cell wall biosynthesis